MKKYMDINYHVNIKILSSLNGEDTKADFILNWFIIGMTTREFLSFQFQVYSLCKIM